MVYQEQGWSRCREMLRRGGLILHLYEDDARKENSKQNNPVMSAVCPEESNGCIAEMRTFLFRISERCRGCEEH